MCKLKLSITLILFFVIQANAQIINIAGPVGSGNFGYSVTVLSNGNYVITDPYFIDGLVMNAGAVYLYNGKTHSLISTLKGGKSDDFVGKDGVIALPNGNFVVLSRSVDNGSIVNCGAITWVNGVTGLSGVIAPANSLYGTATNDSLGSGDNHGIGGVVVFDNSNYAVVSPGWDNGSVVNAGAVTLLNGNGPTSGVISSGNSLVGSSTNDRVGSDGIFILDNSHFIVRSFTWDNGTTINAGAITWCNGISLTGQVSAANSLVGTTTNDFYDDIITIENRIKKLTNGNFVVINPKWDDIGAGVIDAGAVTWGSNSLGLTGVISSNNSLVGTTDYEQVGGGQADIAGVVPLSNGNYVVATPGWDNGASNPNAGAVTWGNGTSGVTGFIDPSNSLVGSSIDDEVGSAFGGWCGVVALANGNYVVGTVFWNNGAIEDVGAVTWGNGTIGITGEVTPTNSLVGSTTLDFFFVYANAFQVKMITPLSNGHYVVATPGWDNGVIINAGAVTWANGNTGIAGEIDSSKSLVGNFVNLELGHVTALPNGNYVLCSPYWGGGVGAVTLINGNTAKTGFLDGSSSLVGSHVNDNVGGINNIVVLDNSNYVVCSQYWDNGDTSNAGAATWGNGMTGVSGTVSSSNSLVGSRANDRVSIRVTALSNGNYVVSSPVWSDGSYPVGAATWGNGNSGVAGPVSSSNSLVGSHAIDHVLSVLPLRNGNYLVLTLGNQVSFGTGKGAVTWGNGSTGIAGVINSSNSLVGTTPIDLIGEHLMISDDHYVVISPHYDNGTLTDAGAATLGSTVSGIVGEITSCNSILGESANYGWRITLAQSDVYGYLLAGQAAHNKIHILQPVTASIAATTDSASVSINGNAPVPLLTSDGCHLIATLKSQGAAPAQGLVKAKMWLEPTVLVHDGHPFVARHYQITPTYNASGASARITLYFTQQEFDDFNSHAASTTNLPASADDTSGIAKLRIVKYPGISNDDSGMPGSYTGTPVMIDPADQDIVWNNSLSRWEISFDVTGFSGFILQTHNVVTGINDITNSSHLLHLFPNPARENLSYELQSTTAGSYTIKIFDLNGRLLYSKVGRDSGNNIKGSIPIDFLSRGTYIMEIATRKATARKKVLKL